MKKIIAAAVASAFVMPVMATEVTIGGELEFQYNATTKKMADNDNLITVTATEELPNGMTVTGKFVVIHDTGDSEVLDNDGTSLSIAGAFGKLTLGDAPGALDATGDWSDVAPAGGAFEGDGTDMAVVYTLPTIVEGLTVIASMSPKGIDEIGIDPNAKPDADAYSLTYNAGAFSVYYGTETVAEKDNYAYGVKATIGPVYVAAEAGKLNDTADLQGLALVYTLGDVKIGYEAQEEDATGDSKVDETVMFVEYNLGKNVDVYIASQDDKTETVDARTTTVGVEYNF